MGLAYGTAGAASLRSPQPEQDSKTIFESKDFSYALCLTVPCCCGFLILVLHQPLDMPEKKGTWEIDYFPGCLSF